MRACRVRVGRVGAVLGAAALVTLTALVPSPAAAAETWSLTLTAFGPTVVPVDTPVLLTVRPDHQVPASHMLYVGMVDDPEHWGGFACGGDGCAREVSSGSPGAVRYAGYVEEGFTGGGPIVSTSNIVTITYTEGDAPVTGDYTVTLEASSTDVSIGETVTLTATSNVELDTTPYYNRVLSDAGVEASCGTGATCDATVSSSEPGSRRFWAQIDDGEGGDVQATSGDVNVTWSAVSTPLEHVERVAGDTRYETAADLATSRWTPGVPVVFVVTGANYPDALAAAPAAARLGGPVLLTQRDVLPVEAATALNILAPAQIVVVGGAGAVSEGVEMQLQSYTTGPVTRIAGADRYSTAVLLSQFAFPASPLPVGGDDAGIVYLASGEGFADALSGAGFAARYGGPLLLTTRDSLPPVVWDEVARLLGTDQGLPVGERGVVVFGGIGAVSENVIDELYWLGVPSEDEILRMAGADRYATSAYIAGTTAGEITGMEVVVATGTNFPDGLVAGALGQPILLLPPQGIPDATYGALSIILPSSALVLGGLGAVSDAQAVAIDAWIGS